MISILPADVDGYKRGQEIILGIKREIAQVGQKAFGEPNILEMETAMLHEAMDDYIQTMRTEHVDPETRKPTAYGNNSVRQVALLKDRHENVMLGQLTLGTIKQAFQYWASRPMKKGTAKPITVRSAENYIKRWKHFLWWLHDSEKYRWKAPSDLLRLKVKVRKTEKETQATISPIQVKSFREEELVILFKYATPLERVYILLGLGRSRSCSDFTPNWGISLQKMGWRQIDILAEEVVRRSPTWRCTITGGVLEQECDALFAMAISRRTYSK